MDMYIGRCCKLGLQHSANLANIGWNIGRYLCSICVCSVYYRHSVHDFGVHTQIFATTTSLDTVCVDLLTAVDFIYRRRE